MGSSPTSRSKLSAEQKDEIRSRYAAGGVLQRELAAELGVSQALIQVICAGTVRPDVPCPRCPKGSGKLGGHRGAHVTGLRRRHLITERGYPHGTTARYVINRCRCRPCKDARAAYERNRSRMQLYGRWDGYVDAKPARDHLRSLSDAGVGYKRVGDICGVAYSSLARIMGSRTGKGGRWRPAHYRPISRTRRSTLAKILAVTVDDALAPGARMSVEDSDVARARVAELVAAGVRRYQIAVHLDPDLRRYVEKGKRPALQVTRHPQVSRETYDGIARLHEGFFRAQREAAEAAEAAADAELMRQWRARVREEMAS